MCEFEFEFRNPVGGEIWLIEAICAAKVKEKDKTYLITGEHFQCEFTIAVLLLTVLS